MRDILDFRVRCALWAYRQAVDMRRTLAKSRWYGKERVSFFFFSSNFITDLNFEDLLHRSIMEPSKEFCMKFHDKHGRSLSDAFDL